MAFAAPLIAAIPASLSTALTVASTVAGVAGAVTAGNANARASEYNAAVADRDAVVADQNRRLAIQQSQIDAEDKRRNNRRVMSSIRTQYGASGLSLAGSPLDVLQDTAVEQELDVQRVEFEGRARGREGALQMLGLREDASLSRRQAVSDRRSGYLSGAGTGLSGAGRALSRVA